VDYVASRHPSKSADLSRNWHAFRVVDGHASLVSECFRAKAVDPPTLAWDLHLEPRCYSCTARINDPRGKDSIWWLSHDPEHYEHCVVCHKPGTGGIIGGTKAILYLRQENGARHSVDAHTVLVHKKCEAEGRALARQQGFGWEYPPAPDWGDPKAVWKPAAEAT
jgi:hypothetical protein